MSDMKVFTVAARSRKKDDEGDSVGQDVTFMHGEREVTFLAPTSDQFIMLSATSVAGSDQAAMGVYIETFFGLMKDDDTRRYFRNRMMDREDPFGIDSEGGVGDIMAYLMEMWSGRPTKQPSDYRPSRSSTGRSSTARTRAKEPTSLTSPPPGS